MPKGLDEKIREVEHEHAVEVVADTLDTHNQSRRDEANRFLGGAMAIDRLKEHLASQVMGALMTIEEEKLYLEYGHQTFADFLDDNKFSQMSKSSYYRLRELFLQEGAAKFDLLTEWGVPAKVRKQLESGDIEIVGDEVVIGGQERVGIGESKVIKAILEKLVTEKNALAGDLSKAESNIQNLTSKIDQGQRDFDELQRNLDRLRSGSPYDRAYLAAVDGLLQFPETIGELSDEVRAVKGPEAIGMLWQLLRRVEKSFGTKFTYRTDTPPPSEDQIGKLVEEVMQDTTGLDETEDDS